MHAMPVPSDEHKKLHFFAGIFVGDETLSPSPWGAGGPAVGRYRGRVICDGFFVAQEYAEEKDGVVNFRGHGLFGYDTQKKQFTWYWVDSMGNVPEQPSYGQWAGDTLQFTSQSAHGRGRYTFVIAGDDRYAFTLEGSYDGGQTWHTQMTGDYRRQPID